MDLSKEEMKELEKLIEKIYSLIKFIYNEILNILKQLNELYLKGFITEDEFIEIK